MFEDNICLFFTFKVWSSQELCGFCLGVLFSLFHKGELLQEDGTSWSLTLAIAMGRAFESQ